MRAYIIVINWVVSLMGLSIDIDHSPFWAVIIVVVWFTGSSLLLQYAHHKGWLDKIIEQNKLEEL